MVSSMSQRLEDYWLGLRLQDLDVPSIALARDGHKTNSASAALNKWLRNHAPAGCVVHSFRHSMRDRLRAIECPFDVIDQIGGWSTAGVGSGYGNGYTIEVLGSWMRGIV